MTVELVCVGTELLLGNIVNTNAAYLAEQCAMLGLSCYHQSVVGDNEERMEVSIRQAVSRSDIVILCGGLGPTKDDLTKEVAAKVFGMPLKEDPHTRERIAEYFRVSGRAVTDNNWKQALVPEGACVIDNDNGTAPGLILEKDGKRAILLPGPPGELVPMFEKEIRPYLNRLVPEGIYSRMVKICGLGESKVESMITDLLDAQTNPTIAPYAKTGEVHLRVTAKASGEDEAQKLMQPVLDELARRFGDRIFTTREEVTLEETVVDLIKELGLTVTTAESCTAGLLAGRIMNVPGASAVYREGYITYANEAKEKLLGVQAKTLEQYGAVSKETACEMAAGAARAAGADVAVSVTGIAGPDGGSAEKPVGLVYIGCFAKGSVRAWECRFTGNRAKNRELSVARGLTILREVLLDIKAGKNDAVVVPANLSEEEEEKPKRSRSKAILIAVVAGLFLLAAVFAAGAFLVRQIIDNVEVSIEEIEGDDSAGAPSDGGDSFFEDGREDDQNEEETTGTDGIRAFVDEGITYEIDEDQYVFTGDESSSVYLDFYVKYPVITGLSDPETEKNVNAAIQSCAKATVTEIYEEPSVEIRERVLGARVPALVSYVEYKVCYANEDFLSIVFDDNSYKGSEEYLDMSLRTLNISLKDATVYQVKDIVELNDEFMDDWLSGMREEAENDAFLSELDEEELRNALAGEDESGVYVPNFFVSADGMEIGFDLNYPADDSHDLGYIWVTAPLSQEQLEAYQTDSSFWKLIEK